jgi:hypothetical protein
MFYRSRNAFTSALGEYDETCRQHDAEMDSIRQGCMAGPGCLLRLKAESQGSSRGSTGTGEQQREQQHRCITWDKLAAARMRTPPSAEGAVGRSQTWPSPPFNPLNSRLRAAPAQPTEAEARTALEYSDAIDCGRLRVPPPAPGLSWRAS